MSHEQRFPDGSFEVDDIQQEQPRGLILLVDPDPTEWSRFGAVAEAATGCLLIAVDSTELARDALRAFGSQITLVAISARSNWRSLPTNDITYVRELAQAVDSMGIRVIGYSDVEWRRLALQYIDMREIMTLDELEQAIHDAFAALI